MTNEQTFWLLFLLLVMGGAIRIPAGVDILAGLFLFVASIAYLYFNYTITHMPRKVIHAESKQHSVSDSARQIPTE
jgi:hypothetical protein